MAGLKSAIALVLDEKDDVGILLDDVYTGASVEFRDATGAHRGSVVAKSAIPFGHKIARQPRRQGETLQRYGYPIGYLTVDLQAGDHVHVHNLISLLSGRPTTEANHTVVRSNVWVRKLIASILDAVGVPTAARDAMTDALTEANLRGIDTHGVRRLGPYVERIVTGGVAATATPEVSEHGGILLVDGRNGIGHYVAAVAADAVSEAARKSGVGVALVRNSNHFGFAGYYATRIASNGQVGVVTSNGQVCITPLGGRQPIFANNPIAVAAPIDGERFVEFDMATSVTSRAKIAEAARAGRPIPLGLAVDEEGNETDNAAAALKGGLLPFGGNKGFGFLFAIEVITGILGGGAYADLVSSKEASPNAPEGTCHFLMALDIQHSIGPDSFALRIADMIGRLKSLPMRAHAPPLRFPGESRWRKRAERLDHGIPLSNSDYDVLIALAKKLGISSVAVDEAER